MKLKIEMTKNQALFERALQHIPGGVNSPVRAFRSVGGTPLFFERAKGAWLWDADGQAFIDYVGSWGPMIVGHSHPDVLQAVCAAAACGLSFGAPTGREVEMADLLVALIPSVEMVRLTSSGTEATMTAIRLARGHTGRDKIIKFAGCYHGHSDSLLVKAGSGALTFGQPSSAGVPACLAAQTLVLDYNAPQQLIDTFAQWGDQIAAVIVEPVVGNMNLITPDLVFLQTMREVCSRYGAVLIFDEVMTGFRVALGGAQSLYGITPDLTTFGKIIGGGMPVGALGGRREIMMQLAPMGPVYQAGTLSGNPVAVAAGLATLKLIQAPGFHQQLSMVTKQLTDGLSAAAQTHGIAFCAQQIGGMFGIYFCAHVPHSYDEVMACDKDAFNHFFHAMLNAGFYFAPSAFEAGFVSAAHTSVEIDATIAAADRIFAQMAA